MKVQKAIDGIEDISNHIRADYALEIGNYTHVIAKHINMLEADNKRLRTRAYNRKVENKSYREMTKDVGELFKNLYNYALSYSHIEDLDVNNLELYNLAHLVCSEIEMILSDYETLESEEE